jgi:hypothetical protein
MTHSVAVSAEAENTVAAPEINVENLVAWMTQLLAERGHPQPAAWTQFLMAGIDGLPDNDYQMFEINRAWRVAFARIAGKGLMTSEESMNVRYSLIDKCPVENWKESFVSGVLPCILRLQLPIQS